MDDSEVPIYTDTDRGDESQKKEEVERVLLCSVHSFLIMNEGISYPPGEKQYTTVHVDKVAESVNVGAGHTAPSTVVQSDASGQR